MFNMRATAPLRWPVAGGAGGRDGEGEDVLRGFIVPADEVETNRNIRQISLWKSQMTLK
jgi:hypothetical protein